MPDGKLEMVDVIVVTALHYFDDIEGRLNDKVYYLVIFQREIYMKFGAIYVFKLSIGA